MADNGQTGTVTRVEPADPASGGLPTEIRLMIWSHYFEVTTLPYHTLTPSTCNFAHAPALLDSTALFRSEALPYYLTRLHVEMEQEETRYKNYLRKRPADDCAESTYEAWVKSLVMLEDHIRALRREVEAIWREVHGAEVLTKKSLLEAVADLGIAA